MYIDIYVYIYVYICMYIDIYIYRISYNYKYDYRIIIPTTDLVRVVNIMRTIVITTKATIIYNNQVIQCMSTHIIYYLITR